MIFASGFSELEQGFSSISSHFQGKNFTNLVLSYSFELWDYFSRILGSFGTHFGHCSIVFGHILVFCVRFSGIRGVPELFWVKNM